MLQNMNDVIGREVYGTDDSLGKIDDCYFDDQRWRIRYLVVDGGWFESKRFLVSPAAFSGSTFPTDKNTRLTLPLTRDRIRNSPRVTGENLTREQETELSRYYGWTPYWSSTPGTMSAGAGRATDIGTRKGMGQAGSSVLTEDDDSPLTEYGLRSIRKCVGYHLQATDGEIGHIDNFFLDDSNWRVRYAQIDTSNLPGGNAVLLSTDWFETVDWDNKKVLVKMTRDAIENSPKFDPKSLNRDYEERLYQHYRRPNYWRAA